MPFADLGYLGIVGWPMAIAGALIYFFPKVSNTLAAWKGEKEPPSIGSADPPAP